jgi:membrane fusion protein (multidrug efflux system)
MNGTWRKRTTGRSSVAAEVLLAVLLGAAGCRKDGAAGGVTAKTKVPSVATERVAQGTLARSLEMTGEVVPVEQVQISATVDGPVGYLPWREGDRVDAGQKLVVIDRELFRAEAAAAEAALALAQARLDDLKAGTRPEEIEKARQELRETEQSATFERADQARVSQLVGSGALPAEERDRARVRLTAAEARLSAARTQLGMLETGSTPTAIAVQAAAVKESAAKLGIARARLGECLIAAPFAGTVTRVFARKGDMAALKTPLLELADLATLVVRCAVPEAHASEVREGMAARVRLDAIPAAPFEARVKRVFPQLDEHTRTRTVELEVPAGVGVAPGMFGRIRLTLETFSDAVAVPVQAVTAMPSGKRVAFVVADGRAAERTVRVGIEDGGRLQILDGLQPGEQVVVTGQEKLKDGAEVRLAEKPGSGPSGGQAGGPVPGGKGKEAGR